jgi:hypothetical protein
LLGWQTPVVDPLTPKQILLQQSLLVEQGPPAGVQHAPPWQTCVSVQQLPAPQHVVSGGQQLLDWAQHT